MERVIGTLRKGASMDEVKDLDMVETEETVNIPEEIVEVTLDKESEKENKTETALAQFSKGFNNGSLPELAGNVLSSAIVSGVGYIVTRGLIKGYYSVSKFVRTKVEDIRLARMLKKENKDKTEENKKEESKTEESASN